MGKRKKKKNKKKRWYYNQMFVENTTKPGQVRQIAVEVFGSTYFTTKDSTENP